ncbi:outer membrane protein assembly factor BamB family protein [Cellulomonas dongxiuzhuiae]|uniref:PQQ-like beta-propeller repeat protein n=1 Tax=Cellulomonas dongxiuzhuiae TaxID=2819979 RepID=A0ABX8GJG6_9CELL|nr:PQQ-binding-like beta-propeller repeat protein [Cellulomonas dongxiuzhuiae]MBO3095151.1 PQQ-binding-like beta-propeller repeat protein [Cellulomonas dongxiuzhuiae]QWC16155.1 PQQ-like beta-propeller repeat protein [Cellulomonas dongxiuzhuiae]
MARRSPLHDVELVDDDEPTATADGAAGPDAGRRGRRALVVGVALVTVLVVGAVVGQSVVDRRERAWVEAVVGQAGAVDLLAGPPVVRWEMTEDRFTVDARTSDGLLVGVQHTGQGPVEVAALDGATGVEAWRVELIDGSTRAAQDTPAAFAWSGLCSEDPGREHRVTCWVHDGTESVDEDGDPTGVPPSVVRVVTLDTRDGTVVRDLTDALDVTGSFSSLVVTRDVVVVSTQHGTGSERVTDVRAVTWDGSPAWDLTVPEPVDDQMSQTYLTDLGDLVAVVTATELRLLDAAGRTVRTMPLDGGYITGWDTGALYVTPPESYGTTTVVRPDGDVDVTGDIVPAFVDDGSVPGLVLTSVDGSLTAWDAEGTRQWSSPGIVPPVVFVLGGRVHLDAGLGLTALDARTGDELWTSDVSSADPLTDGRHLYALVAAPSRGQRSEMVALDPADGSEVWRAPLPDGTDELTSYGGMLVALDRDDDGDVTRITILR